MDFNESFENIKNKAATAAQTAATKAKSLAQIAKANIDIRAEQDKQKKTYTELGKLFYRDYVTGEASDEAEFLPLCDKITESVKKVNELRDLIDDLKSGDTADDAEFSECAEEACECAEEAAEEVCECAEEAAEEACECAEQAEEAVCECAEKASEEN